MSRIFNFEESIKMESKSNWKT